MENADENLERVNDKLSYLKEFKLVSQEMKENFSNRFEWLKKIGSGGYGEVWYVEETIDNEKFGLAMKIVKLEGIEKKDMKILREIVTMKNRSPLCVPLLDYQVEIKSLKPKEIEMKLLMIYYNANLEDWLLLSEGEREMSKSFNMFMQICIGVEEFHNQNLIHRDLKPTNILLNREPEFDYIRCFIADFGLSTFKCSDSDEFKKYLTLCGTYTFAAPEQVKVGDYDSKVDIYALGLIFMLILDIHKDLDELKNKIYVLKQDRKLPYLFTSRNDYCKIGELILQMTDDDPKRRPTINDVISKIKKYIPDEFQISLVDPYGFIKLRLNSNLPEEFSFLNSLNWDIKMSLNEYEVIKTKVGEFCDVKICKKINDENLGELYAIKSFRVTGDPDDILRKLNEMRRSNMLKFVHYEIFLDMKKSKPNFIVFFHVMKLFVMNLSEWRERMERNNEKISIKRKIQIMREIIQSRSFDISNYDYHGNIKPSNILMDYNGYWSISEYEELDFYSLKFESKQEYYSHLKLTGNDKYLTPELLISESDDFVREMIRQSAKIDVYSLGKVFEENFLFEETEELIQKMLNRDPNQRIDFRLIQEYLDYFFIQLMDGSAYDSIYDLPCYLGDVEMKKICDTFYGEIYDISTNFNNLIVEKVSFGLRKVRMPNREDMVSPRGLIGNIARIAWKKLRKHLDTNYISTRVEPFWIQESDVNEYDFFFLSSKVDANLEDWFMNLVNDKDYSQCFAEMMRMYSNVTFEYLFKFNYSDFVDESADHSLSHRYSTDEILHLISSHLSPTNILIYKGEWEIDECTLLPRCFKSLKSNGDKLYAPLELIEISKLSYGFPPCLIFNDNLKQQFSERIKDDEIIENIIRKYEAFNIKYPSRKLFESFKIYSLGTLFKDYLSRYLVHYNQTIPETVIIQSKLNELNHLFDWMSHDEPANRPLGNVVYEKLNTIQFN